MSGHNKWSKIKNKKATEDAKKSKLFSIYAQIISLEAKKSDGDINSPGLKKAIERARGINMPNDNIERAIKKGLGKESANLEEVFYEAYGPGGIAILIEGITDNKNRTTAQIKHCLLKNSGNLGSQGSAVWAFEKTDDSWQAKTPLIIDSTEITKLKKLIDELQDNEDISNVSTNCKL